MQPTRFQDEVTDYKVIASSTRNNPSDKNIDLNFISEPGDGSLYNTRYSSNPTQVQTESRISTKSATSEISQHSSSASASQTQRLPEGSSSSTHRHSFYHEFAQQVSQARLKELFRVNCSKAGFIIRFEHGRKILAEKYKQPSIIKELLCCCYHINFSTMVSFEIHSNALKLRKSITVRYLKGKSRDFEHLISEICEGIRELQGEEKDSSTGISSQHRKSRNCPNCPISQEVQVFEYVSKILNTKENTAFNDYAQKLEKLLTTMEPENPAHKVQKLVQEVISVTSLLNQKFNDNTSHTFNQELLEFAIQRYVWLHFQPKISSIYSWKLKTQNELFESRRKMICQKMNDKACMKSLEIKPKYQLLSPVVSDEKRVPYESAIRVLENLSLEVSPRDKLRCIQEYYSNIKISCYEFHQGREQIYTMDDILPVIIYTVLKAKVSNFLTHVRIVDDYIRTMGKYETDQRVLTNLVVGFEYISKQWQC